MLREIKLENFKCFEHLELRCGALNVLCGLNGAGKSSAIQALLLLRQSGRSGLSFSPWLVPRGDLIDLGTTRDLLFDDAEQDILAIVLGDDRRQENFSFSVGAIHQGSGWEQFRGEILPGDSHRLLDTVWMRTPPFGDSVVYVPAERAGPRRSYPLLEMHAVETDYGPGSEYAWDFLVSNADKRTFSGDCRSLDNKHERLPDLVDQWLQEVCPGAHLSLLPVPEMDAITVGFVFDRANDVRSRRHRAANVGFGLTYAMPVILALLSPPGTLCLMENPEAHLHPRGQTKLAELAVRAACEGVQVFAETHSDHFMDGVRIAIRDGLIEPEAALFHYFERGTDGRAGVTTLTADKDGRLASWPAGFFDQHEENLARLLSRRIIS